MLAILTYPLVQMAAAKLFHQGKDPTTMQVWFTYALSQNDPADVYLPDGEAEILVLEDQSEQQAAEPSTARRAGKEGKSYAEFDGGDGDLTDGLEDE